MLGPDVSPALPEDPNAPKRPWYTLLSRYHWFVFVVAALGWLFDCLDQQLFVLARPAAMEDLLKRAVPADQLADQARYWGDVATSVFIAGWATGGLLFGMLGDRIGRTKTMMITILAYSVCTGLSSTAQGVIDFALYRFITGLGVGGEFAVGVALVAEVMPGAARPYALGSLQALSAVGNISAALINWGLGIADGEGLLTTSPWRLMFLVGALPALLALVIRTRLKEPEAWQKASKSESGEKRLGSYRELFSHPVWRKHALLGLVLACSGVVGLWAIGFYSNDLIRSVQKAPITREEYGAEISAARAAGDAALAEQYERILSSSAPGAKVSLSAEELGLKKTTDKKIAARLSTYQSLNAICVNIGAFIGMFCFSPIAQRIGRRPTFAIALIAACLSTAAVFHYLQDMWQIFVLVPIMGCCQLALFGGYAIYFPELFPTHLRSTGTSFCYNVGRFVAALGPLAKSWLNKFFTGEPGSLEPIRHAGVVMCAVFLIGLLALPFLPETKDQPLPE